MDSIESVIALHPLVNGLSPERRALLVESATVTNFDEGQLIFSDGESAQNFYLVQSGKVALELNFGDEPVRIDTIETGGVIGWAWMFPPYYWHFDARAIEPTRLIAFFGKRLREECERDHILGYQLASHMASLVVKRLQKSRLQVLHFPKRPQKFSALVPN